MLRHWTRRLRRAGRPFGALHRAQRGLAILEMALIMPLVVFLLLLIADFGLLFYGYVGASNSLREGARCGVVGYDDISVIDRVAEASGFVDTVDLSLSSRAGAQVGDDFTVTGTFRHQWITPIVGGLDITQYTRSITMRLETDTFVLTDCNG